MSTLDLNASPDLTINSTLTVGKRVAANTGLMMGSKFLGVFFGAASLFLAAKSLDASVFGIVLFLHAYMLFFAEVATFQSWQSIIRFGTDSVKDNDAHGLAKILNFGVKLDFIAAIFGFLLAISVFYLGAFLIGMLPNMPPDLSVNIATSKPYIFGYCLLIILSQRGASIGIFRLFDKYYVLAIKSLIMPSVRLVGVIIAASMGAGLKSFVLAWFAGSFCAYSYIPIMAIMELRRRNLLRHVIRARLDFWKPGAGIWKFVVKTNLDSTLGAANLHLPMILVFGVFGASWAAVYKIAEEFAKLLSEGYVLLDQVIYPELAKMISLGQADKIWRLVTKAALILLTMGLSLSVVIMLVGPNILGKMLSQDYSAAAPLMSLLVPAAALLGIAAPLYPVFYAADRPERAIYARGTGVIIYIFAFFILASLIGKLAPGWAVILGNATSVALVVYMAKTTLEQEIRQQGLKGNENTDKGAGIASVKHYDAKTPKAEPQPADKSHPVLNLIGTSADKLWGLPLREWQERALKKAGCVITTNQEANLEGDKDAIQHTSYLHLAIEWVLSASLAKAFVKSHQAALVQNGLIIGINGTDRATAEALIGKSETHLAKYGLAAASPADLDDGYNKALRKNEMPFAINVHETALKALEKRQFASAYKGITDFVTKWFWPIPAFYVTRACAALRISPNMVTTIGLILTIAAMYLFWQGQWVSGFIAAWLMTFLDTVDGKLARTTMTYSWWGNIYDHGIDLIHPPFWYFAWFIGLGGSFNVSDLTMASISNDFLLLALLAILIGYVVDRIIEGIFLQINGFHIHVWTRLNSALRFFIARRNPNCFIFMLALMLTPITENAPIYGFYIVAIWTWICIALNSIALITAMIVKRNRPLRSWMDA